MALASTSASSGLHGILVKLHESLSGEDPRSAAFQCQDLVGDVGQECLLSHSESQLGEADVMHICVIVAAVFPFVCVSQRVKVAMYVCV